MRHSGNFRLRLEPKLKEAAQKKARHGDESLARVIRRLLRKWLGIASLALVLLAFMLMATPVASTVLADGPAGYVERTTAEIIADVDARVAAVDARAEARWVSARAASMARVEARLAEILAIRVETRLAIEVMYERCLTNATGTYFDSLPHPGTWHSFPSFLFVYKY